MKIIVKKDGTAVPFSRTVLQNEYPNVSFPSKPENGALESFGVTDTVDTPKPQYDPLTQYLTLAGFEEFEPGKWREVWKINTEAMTVDHIKLQHLASIMRSDVGDLVRALKKALPDVDIMSALQQVVDERVVPPQWDSSTKYNPGDIVSHAGSVYMALPDVNQSPPDEVYDANTMTGGWISV